MSFSRTPALLFDRCFRKLKIEEIAVSHYYYVNSKRLIFVKVYNNLYIIVRH